MYSAEFEYVRPASLAEAIEIVAKNPDARFLAGGHSILPAMKLRLAAPAVLVDISRLGELSGIRSGTDGALEIGALTTHETVASSKEVVGVCPLLAETAAQIGDLQVRNCGTIGGSLAHADPAADYPTAILALEATMTARGSSGDRTIKADEFFTALFETALKQGEILTSISVPAMGKGTGSAYLKHRHPASSYAVVGVAALLSLEGGTCTKARVVVGGVSTKPVRVTGAEEALVGQAANDESFASATAKIKDAVTDPLGDIYASAEFRVHLATVLAKRALALAAERAG